MNLLDKDTVKQEILPFLLPPKPEKYYSKTLLLGILQLVLMSFKNRILTTTTSHKYLYIIYLQL